MKQYLHQIKFKKDYRKVFKEDQVLEFRPGMNLLVGDQGSGKSSLLDLFKKDNSKKMKETIEISCDLINTLAFDTEKDNPRTLGYFKDEMMRFQVQSRWMSHGQTILAIMECIEEAKDNLIFVDEPEAGLSIKSQYKIAKTFSKAIDNGCQVLMATHSVIIMEAFDQVFNLEKMQWMNSKEFVESCR